MIDYRNSFIVYVSFDVAHAANVQSHVILPREESHSQRHQTRKPVDGADRGTQNS